MVNVVVVSKLSMFLEQQGAKNEESCCQLSFHKYTKLDLIFLHGAVAWRSTQELLPKLPRFFDSHHKV